MLHLPQRWNVAIAKVRFQILSSSHRDRELSCNENLDFFCSGSLRRATLFFGALARLARNSDPTFHISNRHANGFQSGRRRKSGHF
jgi:hypothetical protein